MRGPSFRFSLPIVLAVAVGMRLIVLFADPFLSTDVYRYLWDGRVQAAGIDPYRYVPADPALESLRDAVIYPSISRPDAGTPYPPAAQLVFWAVARVAQNVLAMKLAMVGFEALACWAMLHVLALARLPGERVLIYAWNPGAVWSFAGNGHVDAIAIGVLAVALLLRGLRRDSWVGVALGIAVLVKFLPAAMAPALWRPRGQHWAAWRAPIAAIAVMVALYLIYIVSGGRCSVRSIFYFHDEDLAQGSGIWLLSGLGALMALPQSASMIYGACALGHSRVAGCVGRFPATPAGRRCGRHSPRLRRRRTAWRRADGCHQPALSMVFRLARAAVLRRAALERPLATVASAVLYMPGIEVWFYWPCLIYLPAAALAIWEWRQSPPRPNRSATSRSRKGACDADLGRARS